MSRQPERRHSNKRSADELQKRRTEWQRQWDAGPVVGATDSDIAGRAYDLYLQRGGEHGRDLDDWLRAERELRGAMTLTAA